MLVSFIGSPCSGKTTTASAVFAQLKDTGVSSEYIPEYARIYIAEKRVAEGLAPSDKLVLTDADQINIMRQQLHLEKTMKAACGPDVIVVSDTSSLGALLYMSEDCRYSYSVQNMIVESVALQDLVFVTAPIERLQVLDPNRVHNADESKVIHDSINPTLAHFCPEIRPLLLAGESDARKQIVTIKILERMR